MKNNMVFIGFFLCLQLALLGCRGAESADVSDNSLTYTFQKEGESSSALQVFLGSEGEFLTVIYGGQAQPGMKLSIGRDELDDIIALFSMVTPSSATPGTPDCGEEPLVCAAVMATEGTHISGFLTTLGAESLFYFDSPSNLTIEAAQLILALEELRSRVQLEGELIVVTEE